VSEPPGFEKGEKPEDEEHEIIEIGTCYLDIPGIA
jgi:hypothetical protein